MESHCFPGRAHDTLVTYQSPHKGVNGVIMPLFGINFYTTLRTSSLSSEVTAHFKTTCFACIKVCHQLRTELGSFCTNVQINGELYDEIRHHFYFGQIWKLPDIPNIIQQVLASKTNWFWIVNQQVSMYAYFARFPWYLDWMKSRIFKVFFLNICGKVW